MVQVFELKDGRMLLVHSDVPVTFITPSSPVIATSTEEAFQQLLSTANLVRQVGQEIEIAALRRRRP